jgi:hypothetical protein
MSESYNAIPVSSFDIQDPQPNYGPPSDIDTFTDRDNVVAGLDALEAVQQAMDRRDSHNRDVQPAGAQMGVPVALPDVNHAAPYRNQP